VLVVTDIYPAREEPIQGVTGELIANAAKLYGHKEVYYISEKNELPKFLLAVTRKGDIVITMGAGDITKYGEDFLNLLRSKK
jgi:UDP-N-acetylmuramate--alanine ligase